MTLTIPDFSSARVLVAGDVMLDQYWFGATGRISPEAPVPVVHVDRDEERPGGAANVAVNLAMLGCATGLVGIAGEDAAAERLSATLTERGIETALTRDPDRPTTTKLRVLSRNQQLIRLDREETPATAVSLGPALSARLDDADVVILSDYGKGALHDVPALISACRDADLPVLVDPKGSDFARYAGATVITPNESEFRAAAGDWHDDAGLVSRAEQMIDALHLGALLITRSERGMLLVRADAEPFFLSTEAREVYDVTGA
ncbi:MAG: PfkB family carbohydrate kinase, partial [Pseudomonadota bacterium]